MSFLSELELPTVKVETVVPQETITAIVIAFILMVSITVVIIKLSK